MALVSKQQPRLTRQLGQQALQGLHLAASAPAGASSRAARALRWASAVQGGAGLRNLRYCAGLRCGIQAAPGLRRGGFGAASQEQKPNPDGKNRQNPARNQYLIKAGCDLRLFSDLFNTIYLQIILVIKPILLDMNRL
jgi:hypothetical protein